MDSWRSLIEKYDDSNYYRCLKEFPNQVKDSVELGRKFELESFDCRNVLVCGMGGSGITGDLLRQFTFYNSDVPIQTNRFYRVPSWVNKHTLIIGVSHSGNTEETLESFKQARRQGAQPVAVTSDGTMADLAQENDFPRIEIPGDLPPRASAAYLFVPALFALDEVGVASVPEQSQWDQAIRHLEDVVDECEPEQSDNTTQEIARSLKGRIPVIYGSQEVTSVLATRFKNQVNENAKVFAWANDFPEMNHNEIMGLDYLSQNPERYQVILLRDRGEHDRVQRRFEILVRMFRDKVNSIETIESRGRSLLTRYLTLMLETDFVSYYLALANQKDPTSVHYIDQLKKQL